MEVGVQEAGKTKGRRCTGGREDEREEVYRRQGRRKRREMGEVGMKEGREKRWVTLVERTQLNVTHIYECQVRVSHTHTIPPVTASSLLP
jgi:hypothetical protein